MSYIREWRLPGTIFSGILMYLREGPGILQTRQLLLIRLSPYGAITAPKPWASKAGLISIELLQPVELSEVI